MCFVGKFGFSIYIALLTWKLFGFHYGESSLKKTSTIGVIVANILHTFSTEIIRAIEDVCEINHVHIFVCNADDNPEKERSNIEMLMAEQVDGLIIFPTSGNVNWISHLGQDEFGRVIYNFARGEGVDMSQVKFVEGYPTSINFKEIQENGSGKTFYYRYQSPILTIEPEDMTDEMLADIDLLHLTGQSFLAVVVSILFIS